MGYGQLVELLSYALVLLVVMPFLLFWAGRFAKYCARRQPGRNHVPDAQGLKLPTEQDGVVTPATASVRTGTP